MKDGLKTKIEEDFKRALKEKKEIEVSTLKLLKASIFNQEKEKRYRLSKEKPNLSLEELERESFLTDQEIQDVIFSEIKKRREAIFDFKRGGRDDLVKKETKEMEVLQKYLPESLSVEEIKKIVQDAILKVNAHQLKDMGKVIREVKPKIQGRADISLVVEIIKNLLSSK